MRAGNGSSHSVSSSIPPISLGQSIALPELPPPSESELEVSQQSVDELEAEVQAWTAACLVRWAIWGIVQARDDVLAGGVGEFDYLGYARDKVRAFRETLTTLGIAVEK
jgi:choline kinase